jgi:hypothetical protein
MTRTFVSAVAFACLLMLPQSAAAQDPASSVVGVWKLSSVVTKEVATGKAVHPIGEGPIGYTIYTARLAAAHSALRMRRSTLAS